MLRILSTALLGAALSLPIAMVPLMADDHGRTYQDKDRKDEHHWDKREDRAYRMWAKENHRKHQNFQKLKEQDQQSYWGWRHDHSDAVLKINIR